MPSGCSSANAVLRTSSRSAAAPVAGSLAAATEADVVASLEAESSRLAADLAAAEAAAEMPLRPSATRSRRSRRSSGATRRLSPGAAARGPTAGWRRVPATAPVGTPARQRRQHDGVSTAGERTEAVARLAERLASFDRMRARAREHLLADLAAAALDVVAGRPRAAPRPSTSGLRRQNEPPRGARRRASRPPRAASDRSHALEARAEALQAALDEARARAGVERLAGLAGVLGTLADVVEIDDGCERGFEAAVEDALGTVVVDGTAAARDALRHLRDAGLHGGVLADRRVAAAGEPAVPVPPPPEAEPLRRPRAVAACRASMPCSTSSSPASLLCRGGLEEALRLAEDLPGYTIVTTAGDRLSARGWRIGAARSGATRAALETVRRDADAASARDSPRLDGRSRSGSEGARRRPIGERRSCAPARPRRRRARPGAVDPGAVGAAPRALAAERRDVSSAHEAAVGRLRGDRGGARPCAKPSSPGPRAPSSRRSPSPRRRPAPGPALDERARSLAALGVGARDALRPGWRNGAALLSARRDEVERRLAGLDSARAGGCSQREAPRGGSCGARAPGGELARLGGELAGAG